MLTVVFDSELPYTAKLKDAGLVDTIVAKLEKARLAKQPVARASTIEDRIEQSARAGIRAAIAEFRSMMSMDASALHKQTLGGLPHFLFPFCAN